MPPEIVPGQSKISGRIGRHDAVMREQDQHQGKTAKPATKVRKQGKVTEAWAAGDGER